MKDNSNSSLKKGLGTLPVYLTAVSTIMGAIMFLRFGAAVGTLGFWGAIVLVILGHMITIPTALAISEIATNTRVEGGGEYFIISRSFGLKIGSTIGIALYFSQAISVAFYIIAFTESFEPLFNWVHTTLEIMLPRQVISVPVLCVLAYVVLKQGSGSGLKMLYIVTGILVVSLLFFFAGSPIDPGDDPTRIPGNNFGFFNGASFFVMFAICFPAFTGMTAGVGLSGDLRNPCKSIPLGTMGGTITGLVVYIFILWKFSVSASQTDLLGKQLIMADIAVWGFLVIPIGLAAATFSSAIGSTLVAPRTLQALAGDKTFPIRRINLFLAKGKGENREPLNASIVTILIAFVFVLMGDINGNHFDCFCFCADGRYKRRSANHIHVFPDHLRNVVSHLVPQPFRFAAFLSSAFQIKMVFFADRIFAFGLGDVQDKCLIYAGSVYHHSGFIPYD